MVSLDTRANTPEIPASMLNVTIGNTTTAMNQYPSVDIIGDVNGDGLSDFMIGLSGQHTSDTSGRAYLFYGRSTGWPKFMNLSEADVTFTGEGKDYLAGQCVSPAGDVNGDHIDDFLIGAPTFSITPIKGKVYLFFGKLSGWNRTTNLSKADVILSSEGDDDHTGAALSKLGDFNGDGIDDFAVGSYGVSGTQGEVNVFFGRRSWPSTLNMGGANVSFLGETDADHLGMTAGRGGDVNGDGISDIILNAVGYSHNYAKGKVYVFFGKKTAWGDHISDQFADASFVGINNSDWAGQAGGVIGDVNGDGYQDIGIGAPNDDSHYYDEGQVYIILGKANGWKTDVQLNGSSASYHGEYTSCISSYLGNLGDVNDDGYSDFMFSGRQFFLTDQEVYLALGKKDNWAMNMSLDKTLSYKGNGIGVTIGGGGDVDGDGLPDILIGSTQQHNAYLAFPYHNYQPTNIGWVRAYDTEDLKTEISSAGMGQTIYVQVNGADGNSSKIDMTFVNISSDSYPLGYRLRLNETGKNTGLYHGNFTLHKIMNKEKRWLSTSVGEVVTIQSVVDKTKLVKLTVGKMVVKPAEGTQYIVEDTIFNKHFWVVNGTPTTWTFNTNASWLFWDSLAINTTGTPTNKDVGWYWVQLGAVNQFGSTDTYYFNIIVKNVPPVIISNDNPEAFEDKMYISDYNSSDDNDGNVQWSFRTNASWLSISKISGILQGKPSNDQVGKYWVNVSVNDGNGGSASSNFTLTVRNVNDPPRITSKDVLTAFEDASYSVQYNATDIDKGDHISWHLSTNASSWLSIGREIGLLSGTPRNDDVGSYWVNVSVEDMAAATDSNYFILTVMNTNDPPSIMDLPDKTSAYENIDYYSQYFATDIDKGDALSWQVSTNASWLSISNSTGLLSGHPTSYDMGKYWVNITVMDLAKAFDCHNFTLTVKKVNHAPVITSTPVTTVIALEEYRYDLDARDDDQLDVLTYSLALKPDGMTIDARNGIFTWTPTEAQVGEQFVLATVSDGIIEVSQNFNITVMPANHRPVIQTFHDWVITLGHESTFQVNATDPDGGSVLRYSFDRPPDGMIILTTGLITWNPTKEQVGTHTVIVNVTDGKAYTTQTLTVVVKKEKCKGRCGGTDNSTTYIAVIVIVISLIAIVTAIIFKKKAKPNPQNLTNQSDKPIQMGSKTQ